MPKALSRQAATRYKLAQPLSAGEVLEDVEKRKWKLGPPIGQEESGEIYLAQELGSKTKFPYVVKIEPQSNEPLLVEMNFYLKNAKSQDVKEFKNKKGLKTFGMPLYVGSGSHDYNGEKYRFIVMEKFGKDLWNIFLENNRHFPTTTVFKIAIQILDVLEYIHSKGYVHADIKGENILLGVTKDTQNKQVYLVNFGLTTKCDEENEFKPNNGTIEYFSRDAHNGVQTKRGDLETLAYNLIHWLGCILPWEKNLKDSNAVQKAKEEYMHSVPKFIKACFDKRSPPGPIVDFLNCISTLEHSSTPDYKTIRKIFLSGLTSGDTLGKPFQFSVPQNSPTKMSLVKKKNEDKPISKRKRTVKEVNEEVLEHEKENVDDDLSDTDVIIKNPLGNKEKEANGAIEIKGKNKVNARKRTKKDSSKEHGDYMVDPVTVDNNHVPEEEISDSAESKKRKITTKKKINKVVSDEDNVVIEEIPEKDVKHVPEEEKMCEPLKKSRRRAINNIESKEKPKAKGKKKIAKDINGKALSDDTEQEIAPDVTQPSSRNIKHKQHNKEDPEEKATPIDSQNYVRITRQRGKLINYTECLDDEKKPSKIKSKTVNAKEVHVTGDSGAEEYTDTLKQVVKKKSEVAKKK